MEVELEQRDHQFHHLLGVFHEAFLQFLSIANLREGGGIRNSFIKINF